MGRNFLSIEIVNEPLRLYHLGTKVLLSAHHEFLPRCCDKFRTFGAFRRALERPP